jgi:hypothetical protein
MIEIITAEMLAPHIRERVQRICAELYVSGIHPLTGEPFGKSIATAVFVCNAIEALLGMLPAEVVARLEAAAADEPANIAR